MYHFYIGKQTSVTLMPLKSTSAEALFYSDQLKRHIHACGMTRRSISCEPQALIEKIKKVCLRKRIQKLQAAGFKPGCESTLYLISYLRTKNL